MGPCDNTFFSAWSTYAATSRVYSGGRSDRTVYSSPPIITLTACFLVLTEPPPPLAPGALPPAPAPPPAERTPPLPPASRACSSRNVRRGRRPRTRPPAARPPRQQRIRGPLAPRPLGIAERAGPGPAAVPCRDAGPPILIEHLEPLEQRPHGPPQDVGHLGGGDARRKHQRQVPLDRRLQRQRPVYDQIALGGGDPHLEAEQRRRPHRRVGLEGACPPHRLPAPLHRHPAHLPTRCRFHVAVRGSGTHG